MKGWGRINCLNNSPQQSSTHVWRVENPILYPKAIELHERRYWVVLGRRMRKWTYNPIILLNPRIIQCIIQHIIRSNTVLVNRESCLGLNTSVVNRAHASSRNWPTVISIPIIEYQTIDPQSYNNIPCSCVILLSCCRTSPGFSNSVLQARKRNARRFLEQQSNVLRYWNYPLMHCAGARGRKSFFCENEA